MVSNGMTRLIKVKLKCPEILPNIGKASSLRETEVHQTKTTELRNAGDFVRTRN